MKFRRQKPPVTRQIQVVRSTSLRLEDWRKDPTLVKAAYDLEEKNPWVTMLAVLRNESPLNYALPLGANHEDRIAHAARAEGYQMAINNLEAMAVLHEEPQRIESEFKPEIEYKSEPIPATAPVQLQPQFIVR